MTQPTFDMQKIIEVVLAFNGEKDYFVLLGTILDKMMEMTRADAGTLYVCEDDELHFRIVRNNTLGIRQSAAETAALPPVRLDKRPIENICAYGAVHNEIVMVDDVYHSDRFNFNGPKQYDRLTGYRTRSMLVLPLTAAFDGEDEVMGVIQLMNASDPDTGETVPFFDVHHPPVLPAFARVAANMLANLFYAKEVKDLFHSFIAVMTQAIDERSPYNRSHTQHVSEYCEAFARYLNKRFPLGHAYFFDEGRRERLVMAAYLHDIGKIITPLSVMDKPDRLGGRLELLSMRFAIKRLQTENAFLTGQTGADERDQSLAALADAQARMESLNTAVFLDDSAIKSVEDLAAIHFTDTDGHEVPLFEACDLEALRIRKGTLTDGERHIMQEHVALTGRLLDKMIFNKHFRDVPAWAKSHHEFLDGTGYPENLKEDRIPLETCILTIMDIFDALTASDRPYKEAIPVSRALDIVSGMAQEGKLHREMTALFIESRIWEAFGL